MSNLPNAMPPHVIDMESKCMPYGHLASFPSIDLIQVGAIFDDLKRDSETLHIKSEFVNSPELRYTTRSDTNSAEGISKKRKRQDGDSKSLLHPSTHAPSRRTPRKFSCEPDEVRREKNRASAARSRQRQRERMKELENQVKELQKRNEELNALAMNLAAGLAADAITMENHPYPGPNSTLCHPPHPMCLEPINFR